MMSYLPEWLVFASDAEELALVALALLAVSGLALVMDRKRHRRDRIGSPDSVGWMPWTGVFFASAVLGLGLMAVAAPALLKG